MAAPAEPGARPALKPLTLRIISAAVLIPIVVIAVYAGGYAWAFLVTLFAVVMIVEWCLISSRAKDPHNPQQRLPAQITPQLPIAVFVVFVAVGNVAAFAQRPWSARWESLTIAALTLTIGALICFAASATRSLSTRFWPCLGVVYVAIPCAAVVWLRADPTVGLQQILWIVALVIFADTGAYIAGRSIGGPKLAPRISPNKTWAGLGGAIVSAAIMGAITAFLMDRPSVWPLTLVSGGLGIVAQIGDLAESAFKRHFGVKDASNIIPGHGGVLDRVDGLIAVAATVAGINEWIGSSVLTWL